FADDGTGSSGLIVNETFVRRYLAGEDPIGRALDRGTIVGVVGDVRQTLRAAAEPEIYAPLARTSYSAATLVISGTIPADLLIAPVRAAIRELNPSQPVYSVQTMDAVIASAHADVDLFVWLIGVFAALALVLSAAGIYGVTSWAVASRRQELAIRAALGAGPGRIVGMVLRQGVWLVVSGVCA